MRALVVHPGPEFSVADVFNGYCEALTQLGVEVMPYNLNDRMTWGAHAFLEAKDGSYVKAFPTTDDVYSFALSGLYRAAYRWWPDVILFISGFVIDADFVQVARARGHKVACVFTESPYEDSRQLATCDVFDAVALNDPVHLDQFTAKAPAIYTPHAYRPDIHHPGTSGYKSDCVFVGTGYPSRHAFMERVDWSGIDLALAGNWEHAPETLTRHVVHDLEDCVDNDMTAELYRGSATSFNLYRAETNGDVIDTDEGVAVGPREVELAACGTWFARQSRPESDELFPMLPTFSSPEELGDQIRWALAHPDRAAEAATAARHAIADRTFPNNVRRLFTALGI